MAASKPVADGSMPELEIAGEGPCSEAAARLIEALCAELSERYHRPPSPFSTREAGAVVVARLGGEPVGCGAFRRIDETTVEVKRMFVVPAFRRRGISRRVLDELERIASGSGYERVILETGIFQPEAIALYLAAGYARASAYGRYVGNEEALCFSKTLRPGLMPESGR